MRWCACEKAGNPNMVYMYFSTSKITFPGAGLAGMASSKENITAIKKRMMVQSIGPDKINQLRHMKFFVNLDGLLDQMKKHAEIIRPKFEAVEKTLTEGFADSGIATWSKPNGGYFVSLNVLDGCAKKTVRLCKDAGVTLTKQQYPHRPHLSHRGGADRGDEGACLQREAGGGSEAAGAVIGAPFVKFLLIFKNLA